jgi:hypothetical protein
VLARIKSVLACGFLFKVSGCQYGGSERGIGSLWWVIGVVLLGFLAECVFVLEEWNDMYESSFPFPIGSWSFFPSVAMRVLHRRGVCIRGAQECEVFRVVGGWYKIR